MSDFPLTTGRQRARSANPFGNRIEIQVVSGEVVSHPDYGLFVAHGVATFKAILHPAPGFHALPALVERASHNITINFQIEPVEKIIIRGWFSNKPFRPRNQPDGTPWPNEVDEKTEFIEAWVRIADFDVDSDNNNSVGLSRNAAEDSVEAPAAGSTSYGKIFKFCPDLDTNINGVPDFADGIDIFGNAGTKKCRMWPVAVLFLQGFNETEANPAKVRFEYPGSDPASVTKALQVDSTFIYTAAAGKLRLWTQDGPSSRKVASVPSGSYIQPGTAYHFSDLDDAKVAQGHWRFFMEPIGSSTTSADSSIEVWVDPFGQGNWLKADHVSFTVLPVRFTVTNYNPLVAYADALNEQPSFFTAGRAGMEFPGPTPDPDGTSVQINIGNPTASSLTSVQNAEANLWTVGWIHNMVSYDLVHTFQNGALSAKLKDGVSFPLADCPANHTPYYPFSTNFHQNLAIIKTEFSDFPFDLKACWNNPENGTGNPITQWHLNVTFRTWLVAKRLASNDYIYLRYASWSVANSATIDVLQPVGQRVTLTRLANLISSGVGKGPDTPKLVGPSTFVQGTIIPPAF